MNDVNAPHGAKDARQDVAVAGSVLPGSGAVGLIYVVVGTCGEYSDRQEWLVRAFRTEGVAQTFAEDCKRSGMEVYAKLAAIGPLGRYSQEADIIKHTALDPNYSDDYTGPPDYTVAPCPFGAVARATANLQESPAPTTDASPSHQRP